MREIITEKVVKESTYIAEDNTVFINKEECIKYENKLKAKKHPVTKSCIETTTFCDLNKAKLYYIRNYKDYDFLLNELNLYFSEVSEDFNKFGEGWYIYYQDAYGCKYIYNYNNYLEELKQELKSFIFENNFLIKEKEKNLNIN